MEERKTSNGHPRGLETAPAAPPWEAPSSSAIMPPRFRAMSSSNSFTRFELRRARSSSRSRSCSRSSSYELRCRSISATKFPRRSPAYVRFCPWCTCGTVCNLAVSLPDVYTRHTHARTHTHTHTHVDTTQTPHKTLSQTLTHARSCRLAWRHTGRNNLRDFGPAHAAGPGLRALGVSGLQALALRRAPLASRGASLLRGPRRS